ncbi:MAG TPA: hypothetical protein VEY30_02580 [Myxococcaceae bacterium]|nr:hypothetical protein [Myxococcaceae bacterium]
MNRRLALPLFLCIGCAGSRAQGPGSTSAETAAKTAAVPDAARALPVVFRENRIFLNAVTEQGQPVAFYVASGGKTFLRASAARHLQLPVARRREGGTVFEAAVWPAFGLALPPPAADGATLPVLPDGQLPPFSGLERTDGILGRSWFAARVWTLDYPGKQMLLWEGSPPPGDPTHTLPLRLPEGAAGAGGPRVTVLLAGEPAELALDTGVTVHLSRAAIAALNDGRPLLRAASAVSRSTFETWRNKHPAWRVIDEADVIVPGEDLIEVPELTVAGQKVGPVWFVTRPDGALGGSADDPLSGTLGGSALSAFRLTLDYVRRTAHFDRPQAP